MLKVHPWSKGISVKLLVLDLWLLSVSLVFSIFVSYVRQLFSELIPYWRRWLSNLWSPMVLHMLFHSLSSSVSLRCSLCLLYTHCLFLLSKLVALQCFLLPEAETMCSTLTKLFFWSEVILQFVKIKIQNSMLHL